MDVLKILTALSPVYGFQVYGEGEFEPDYEGLDPAKAMEHITAQDMTSVYLWYSGAAVGELRIVCDPEPDIYDYGSSQINLRVLLDDLTRED